MTYLANKALLLCNTETTYNEGIGTTIPAGTPEETYAMLLTEIPTIEPVFTDLTNPEIHGGFSKVPSSGASGTHWHFTFKFLLRPSGTNTAGTTDAPRSGPLFKASGHTLTTDVWTPDSANATGNGESLAFILYLDGKKYIGTGGRCNLVIEGEAGDYVMCTADGYALYTEPTDEALPDVAAYGDSDPIIARSVAFDFGTYDTEVVASKFTFDVGNQIEVDKSLNDSNGIGEIVITGRQTKLSIDPEMVATSTFNLYNSLTAGTQLTFTMTLGSGTDKVFTIATNTNGKVQVANAPSPGARTGKFAHDGLEFQFVAPVTDEDGDYKIEMS